MFRLEATEASSSVGPLIWSLLQAERERERERETHTHTHRQTDGQTERERGRARGQVIRYCVHGVASLLMHYAMERAGTQAIKRSCWAIPLQVVSVHLFPIWVEICPQLPWIQRAQITDLLMSPLALKPAPHRCPQSITLPSIFGILAVYSGVFLNKGKSCQPLLRCLKLKISWQKYDDSPSCDVYWWRHQNVCTFHTSTC